MVQQKMSAFSPQLYVSKKLEEAKLQWKKEKLNNIGVLQKKVLVSEIKIKFLIDRHQSTSFCPKNENSNFALILKINKS